MKKLLIVVVIVGLAFVFYKASPGGASKPSQPSVYIGAPQSEVEQVFGQPLSELPNFGNTLRTYKAKSGKKYTLLFDPDNKVLEIHE